MKNYCVIRWFIPALGMVCGLGCAASSGGGATEATVAPEPVTVAVVKPCTRPVKMDAVPLVKSAKPQAAKPAIKAPRVVVVKAKPAVVAAVAPHPPVEMWEGSGKCEGVASFYAGQFLGRKTANG